jgi:hypothetical protein
MMLSLNKCGFKNRGMGNNKLFVSDCSREYKIEKLSHSRNDSLIVNLKVAYEKPSCVLISHSILHSSAASMMVIMMGLRKI